MAKETLKAIMEGVAVKDGTKPKLVANNTVRYTRPDGDEAYRLHHTDIVVVHADGSKTLNTGGWLTPTTKDRICCYGAQVCCDRGLWYLAERVPFFDGMRIDAAGKPLDPVKPDLVREQMAMKKRISKFCKLVDKAEKLPFPGNGDCWFCCMYSARDGKPLGDINGNVDHLLSHMDEEYLHGSLLVNAMRDRGYTDQSIGLHYQMNLRDTFKRALRAYLTKRLGAGATKGYAPHDEPRCEA